MRAAGAIGTRWLGVLAVAGICWPVMVHGWVHLCYVVGRLVLGRWPAMSVDDPAYIPGVQVMHVVGWLAVLVTPVALFGGGVALAAVARRGWVGVVVCIVAVWLAHMAALLAPNPGYVWEWFID